MSETLREEDLGQDPAARMRQALIPDALYVATESFWIKNPVTGADEHVRKGVDRARGRHPYVQQVPMYWEPVQESVKYDVFEAAVREPDSKRLTSTPIRTAPASETSPEVLSQGAPDHSDTGVSGQVNATATAIAHAKDLGVDISKVTGTGKDGQVVKSDVAAYADAQTQPS